MSIFNRKNKAANTAAAEDSYTEIWRQYQDGKDYFNQINLNNRADKCFHFVAGDQWYEVPTGDENPAVLNILRPIMKNSTAMVGQNNMTIHYSSMDFSEHRQQYTELCDKLNAHAIRVWERTKMDMVVWDVIQDAFTAGDSFLYFFDSGEGDNGQSDNYIGREIKVRQLDTTNVMLADENNPLIQEQPYILIIQRRYLRDVIAEAKGNGISQEEIDRITYDDETEDEINGEIEVDNKQKITTIIRFQKKDGIVNVCRSTKTVVYQQEEPIEGMTLYPIAKYTWNPIKGQARGMGDIWYLIPAQISVNVNYYRFDQNVKETAFPKLAYNAQAIDQPSIENLSTPGAKIAMRDSRGKNITELIQYLQAPQISPYAKDVWQELIQLTRELSGAGDNLENINPEQASGAAINAAREAKALNVNAQVAAYKQFIEDTAHIWFDMWLAYNPNGMEIVSKGEDGTESSEIVSADELRAAKIYVKIDVSPSNPYSKLSAELTLQELFNAQAITIDEYVDALDDDSAVPKTKLKEILDRREKQQQDAAAQKIVELTQIIQQLQAQLQEASAAAQGGAAAQEKLVALTNAMQTKDFDREQKLKDLDMESKAVEVERKRREIEAPQGKGEIDYKELIGNE
ncbi:MAG: hypothetical protein VB118_04760 [Oscillospiraceae bacterium]|nr:hypothetical protein [Oscillospiraceae bacterium]